MSSKDALVPSKAITLVTQSYPTKNDLYSGAFIKSRADYYCQNGFSVSVLIVKDQSQGLEKIDYLDGAEDIRIVNFEEVLKVATQSPKGYIFAHSMKVEWIRRALSSGLASKIAFWFHGYEVRNPTRLAHNFQTDSVDPFKQARSRVNMISANKLFAERRGALRELFQAKDVTKVFVSNYLKEIAENDVGVPIENARIIPNPVDVDFFYPPEARDYTKVLFLRPFKARNYGCDLMQQVVLRYSELRPNGKLNFTICGDGPLHDQCTSKLQKLKNVEIIKKFFSKQGIKRLHSQHGILLQPTRFDTQGITMCEAMSSGMIVITNRVAAVSEFIDESSGFLCGPESVEDMVNSLIDIESHLSEQNLDAMSTRARHRVVSEISSSEIAHRELEI